MEHPKLYRNLLNLTKDDPKIPTDEGLDDEIEILGMHMHVVWPLLKKIIRKRIYFFFRYKWKTTLKRIAFIGLCIACIILTWKLGVEPRVIKSAPETVTVTNEIYTTNLKSFTQFMHAVGKCESGNNWRIVSTGGMLGYFQFYTSDLPHIGISVSKEEFLKDTMLQIVAFKRNLHYNKNTYQKYINKYQGAALPQDQRYIMTESGILMAFHLKPSGAVRYFESGCLDDSDTDGNGTSVSAYIKKFSGYKIE